jgi:hypothetical protein
MRTTHCRTNGKEALDAASKVPVLWMHGQDVTDREHGLMGEYRWVEGKVVNGRGVWRKHGCCDGCGWDSYVFFARGVRSNCWTWVIGKRPLVLPSYS